MIILVSLSLLIPGCAHDNIAQKSSPTELYEKCQKLYEEGEYRKIIEILEVSIFDFRSSDIYEDAEMLLANSYFYNDEYQLALAEFRKVARNFPNSKYSEEIEFMIGRIYYELSPRPDLDQDYTYKAISQLEDFIHYNPAGANIESGLYAEAKDILYKCYNKLAEKKYKNAKLYFKLRKFESAKIYLNDLISEYSHTDWVPKALLLLGEIYMELDEEDEALNTFQRLIDNYPSATKQVDEAKHLIGKIDV